MFAIRFFAAATLAAAVPWTSAAEPFSSRVAQLSLSAPRRQPVGLRLLPADSLAATSNGIATAPLAETSMGQPHNPQLSGLVAMYAPAGSPGAGIALNLLTPQSSGFQTATTTTSLGTRPQLLLAPAEVQSAPTWPAPGSASALFAKPALHGTLPR
jgi:hypothetical protein